MEQGRLNWSLVIPSIRSRLLQIRRLINAAKQRGKLARVFYVVYPARGEKPKNGHINIGVVYQHMKNEAGKMRLMSEAEVEEIAKRHAEIETKNPLVTESKHKTNKQPVTTEKESSVESKPFKTILEWTGYSFLI